MAYPRLVARSSTPYFQRFLSEPAFARAEALAPLLTDWATQPGSTVHLRRGNEVALYHLGHKALSISGLGGGAPTVHLFGGEESELPEAGSLRPWLALARRQVEAYMEEAETEGQELAAQGRLLGQLALAGSDYLLVDEQVMVPRAALLETQGAETRVDAVVVGASTGQLWLLEIKLAVSTDLDGKVLEQLVRTAALPRQFREADGFVTHYREVVRQKQQLGILPRALPDLLPSPATAAVAIGDVRSALARIACWEGQVLPADLKMAVLEPGAPLRDQAFKPLPAWLDRSRREEHDPYAPRKPRWNDFTLAEDAAQEAWRQDTTPTGQLGPLEPHLLAYLQAHDAPQHRELQHARSSQAACFQLFAPLLIKDAAAEQGFLALLNDRLLRKVGLVPEAIKEVDFEAPHGKHCLDPASSCWCAAQMGKLVGERTGITTRLDALLRVQARNSAGDVVVIVGIEFKYTEAEFGGCGGFRSTGMGLEERASCLSGTERANRCFLRQRLYLSETGQCDLFGRDVLLDPGPCAFVGGVNQLLRGHTTTLRLAEREEKALAVYVVVHDARNAELTSQERTIPAAHGWSVPAPLERYRALLRPERASTFGVLTAQEVMEAYRRHKRPGAEPNWLTALHARYRW